MARCILAAAATLLALASWPSLARSSSPACATSLSAADEAAVGALVEAYRTSWLKGDQAGVLATFADDAVLLPANGAAPIIGKEAIKAYWWPAGGAPTTITMLEITVDQLQGDCNIAYSHGQDNVAWVTTVDQKSTAAGHPGTYVNVYERQANGEWKIARHMWGDGPPMSF